jgi:hypothetical protein
MAKQFARQRSIDGVEQEKSTRLQGARGFADHRIKVGHMPFAIASRCKDRRSRPHCRGVRWTRAALEAGR